MHTGLIFFTLMTLVACGQHTQETSDTRALVSQKQAAEAFDIIQEIDYLPFTYIEDGCYARSLYMSLELAAVGIPSSAQYVYGALQPTLSVAWSYHVAPLLQLKNSGREPWVLDPAFEIEPLTRTQWIHANFAKSSTSSYYWIARDTITRIRAGSAYFEETGRTDPYDTEASKLFDPRTDSSGAVVGVIPRPIDTAALIPDFEAMPTFLSSDVHSACTVMYDYIQVEKVSDQSRKISRLLSSTTRLVKAVSSLNKLTRDRVYGFGNKATRECATAMAGYSM
jgi:hypothetical protein